MTKHIWGDRPLVILLAVVFGLPIAYATWVPRIALIEALRPDHQPVEVWSQSRLAWLDSDTIVITNMTWMGGDEPAKSYYDADQDGLPDWFEFKMDSTSLAPLDSIGMRSGHLAIELYLWGPGNRIISSGPRQPNINEYGKNE